MTHFQHNQRIHITHTRNDKRHVTSSKHNITAPDVTVLIPELKLNGIPYALVLEKYGEQTIFRLRSKFQRAISRSFRTTKRLFAWMKQEGISIKQLENAPF